METNSNYEPELQKGNHPSVDLRWGENDCISPGKLSFADIESKLRI